MEKLAVPAEPSAVFRAPRKLAGVKVAGVPLSAVIVPASKSMAILVWITPEELTTETLVLPVKPDTAVGRSRPVLRPVSLLGGGAALEALCAMLIWSTARVTYSLSCCCTAGMPVLRRSTRPFSSPEPSVSGAAEPPGAVEVNWPALGPVVEKASLAAPTWLTRGAPLPPRMSIEPSGLWVTVTSIIEDRVLTSWPWLFCAPVTSPPLAPSRAMMRLSWLIWSRTSLTCETSAPIRLSVSPVRLLSWAEMAEVWSRKLEIDDSAVLRVTEEEGSCAAEAKLEKMLSSWLK